MDKTTIATYDRNAEKMAADFNQIGVRISDIDETFKLVNMPNPNVLEVGCGNGRDAQEILKRTNKYLGIDASLGMIELARRKVPNGNFILADMETFVLPSGLDIVFAFASLLHTSKEHFADILSKVYAALNTGGVVRISVKYDDSYREFVKQDEWGTRVFYLYSAGDVEEIAGDFSIIKMEITNLGKTRWLEILLRKPDWALKK